jgi:GH35 family endo-1,4-beta-xylanase
LLKRYFHSVTVEDATKTGCHLRSYQFEEADRITNFVRDCITLWGVSDDMTWLDYFPVERKNGPLLFDEHGQPKEAYWRIIDF